MFINTRKTFVRYASEVAYREVAFHKLSILPMGSEGQAPAERRAENIALGVTKADAPPSGWPEDEEESVHALIPNVELKLRNAGATQTTKHPFSRHDGFSADSRCFVGEVLGGEYCLEQTDAGDVAIAFRRKRALEQTEEAEFARSIRRLVRRPRIFNWSGCAGGLRLRSLNLKSRLLLADRSCEMSSRKI